MKFIIITLILFVAISFITSCKSTKENPTALDIYNSLLFIVRNQDSTNSYTFALTSDNNFAYTISKKDSTEEYYNGICRITSNEDTIFLMYTKNRKPAFTTDYLVKERSGKGYIQYFTDGRKKEFLFSSTCRKTSRSFQINEIQFNFYHNHSSCLQSKRFQ